MKDERGRPDFIGDWVDFAPWEDGVVACMKPQTCKSGEDARETRERDRYREGNER